MNSNLISKAVRYALMAGAVSAVAAPSVYAADADQTSSTDQSSTAQLGKIEVTGTRIKRTTVETAQPVTIVSAQQIKQSGFASVGDVLQSLNSTGSALNSQVNNGNDGQENVDLRNLGAQRLLVLVNGRRWVTQINNVVDFYTIPASVIDHIEILQDGASAIYGSDAIAGVINVITMKNYNGAEANAYMGIYKGDGHTDGKKQIYDFTLGSSGDRSGVMMSVSYTNEQAIWAGNRTISKEAIYGVGGGSSAIPGGRFLLIGGACAAAHAANPTISVGSSGTCDLTTKTPGASSKPGLADLRNFSFAKDAYNYAPLNYLLAPNERTSFFAQGHYDLADNLTFTSELMFNNRTSQQSLAPAPLFLGLDNQGTTNNGIGIGVAKDNPYNPFGVDLVPYFPSDPNFAAWCAAYGSPTCATTGTTAYRLRRRPLEAGNRYFNQNVDTYHWAGGFKGYFNMMGGEWDWDVNAAFGKNYQNTSTNGQFNTSRLQEAMSEACGTATDPTCVPLDLFGGVGTAGSTITPAMVAYTTFEEHNIIVSNSRDYTANIGGDLFDLPAGPVGLALGYEYLEQDGYFHPDALRSLGNTTDNVAQPTNGRVATNAQYFEFNIPLVTDAPFMKDVSLDIADRFSQFKWGGIGPTQTYVPGADHAHTARAALRWQANDDLLLRASWSQGFRVPSISEFYAGAGNNFPAVTDPCTAGGAAQGSPNCVNNGRPANTAAQSGGQIQTIAGGNASLHPERSISKTVGFVWNPDFIPGYDLSLDYYDIYVGNLSSTYGAQTIVNGCYFAGDPHYCSLLTIAGRGTAVSAISSIANFNTNVGSLITDGFDFSTHYKLPSTSAGDFKVGLDITFLKRYDATVPDAASVGGFDTSRLAGWSANSNGGSFPKRRATLSLDWHYGDFSANYSLFFVDHMVEPCLNANASPTTILGSCTFNYSPGNAALYQSAFGVPLPNNGPVKTYGPAFAHILPNLPHRGLTEVATNHPYAAENHIGAVTYTDISGTYHMDSWNSDFTFGIQNLWGKQPPMSMSAFANSYSPFYNRIPGRFFYGRVGVKF